MCEPWPEGQASLLPRTTVLLPASGGGGWYSEMSDPEGKVQSEMSRCRFRGAHSRARGGAGVAWGTWGR